MNDSTGNISDNLPVAWQIIWPSYQKKLEFTMKDRPRIPDRETRRRSVEKLREVCRQYDILNELLDRAIASAEEDIRNSPLGAYRLRKAKETALQTSTNESDS